MTDEQEPHDLPEDVQDALDRIAKDDPDGLIQTEAVVEAAQDPESPLHKYFDWNDATAAHQHRLAQARKLVRNFTIRVIDEGPKYVDVVIREGTPEARRGYVPLARAVVDENLYDQIAADARKAIRAWRNRLSAFDAARGAVATLDDALAQMQPTTTEEGDDDA